MGNPLDKTELPSMIIGLSGKARSGKDTVANYLSSSYGFHHYWFSKPMKEACRAIFGWSDEHLYGDLKDVVDPAYFVSPRVALQTMGTEWGRNMINQDIWLKVAQKQIEANPLIVISDVRYDNEAEAIINMGGVIIDVTREDIQNVAAHASESGISKDLIYYTLDNNGSLDSLYMSLDRLLLKEAV